MLGTVASIIIRVLALCFSAVVLGLSINMIRGEATGYPSSYTSDDGVELRDYSDSGAPAQTGYTAFVGAWALLFCLIGFAGDFISSLQGLFMGVADSLTALITLIGGIVYAVGLRGGSCGNDFYVQTNRIIRGAGTAIVVQTGQATVIHTDSAWSRCHQAQAIMVFCFFLFACFTGTAVIGLIGGKGRRGNSYA